MKYIANNILSLVGHVLVFVWIMFLGLIVGDMLTATDIPFELYYYLSATITILLYVACGFIMRPVERFSFFSMILLMLILATLLVIIYEPGGELIAYLYFNPILFFFGEITSKIIINALLFLSPIIPSLFMYFGILLRKHFRR